MNRLTVTFQPNPSAKYRTCRRVSKPTQADVDAQVAWAQARTRADDSRPQNVNRFRYRVVVDGRTIWQG